MRTWKHQVRMMRIMISRLGEKIMVSLTLQRRLVPNTTYVPYAARTHYYAVVMDNSSSLVHELNSIIQGHGHVPTKASSGSKGDNWKVYL